MSLAGYIYEEEQRGERESVVLLFTSAREGEQKLFALSVKLMHLPES